MIDLRFNWPNETPQILFLGAHSDDIELGCGGTILNICSEKKESEIHWVVFSFNPNPFAFFSNLSPNPFVHLFSFLFYVFLV